MGEKAQEWVDSKFSKQRMVNNIVEVYEGLIRKKLKTRTVL